MTRRNNLVVVLCFAALLIAGGAKASPGSTLLTTIGKHLGRQGGAETAEKFGKEVGETVVERVATKVTKEGGEQALESTAALTARHGPDVLRAIDNSPAARPILAALDDLPGDQIPKAAARLAAGTSGKELAETTVRHGSRALRAEIAHPGVGGRFVKALGTDGASLCDKLATDQVIVIGKHLDDIEVLPPSLRSDLLQVMVEQTDRFAAFVGRFVENNPGKALFSVAGTTVVLANSERLLGGDEIVINPDGTHQVVSKPGLLGRAGEGVANTGKFAISAITVAAVVVGLALVVGKHLNAKRRARRSGYSGSK